jgi:hypothetical protein
MEQDSNHNDEEQPDIPDDIREEGDVTIEEHEEPQPLVRVRYGLGKELLLYPDTFVVARREEREETTYPLANIRRLILMPGEYTPSKLVLLFDLDDDTTVVAAEGVTNVRDLRKLLARLTETHPEIELDPPDMDEQLRQALDIRKRSLIGCYGFVIGACLLVWIVYLVVAFIGGHGPH